MPTINSVSCCFTENEKSLLSRGNISLEQSGFTLKYGERPVWEGTIPMPQFEHMQILLNQMCEADGWTRDDVRAALLPKKRTTLELFHDLPFPLLVDLYGLTQGAALFAEGLHEVETVFHAFFRKHPYSNAGYSIVGGIDYVQEFLKNYIFTTEALDCLSLKRAGSGRSERPLFSDKYLNYLSTMRFCADIDAVPEGTVMGATAPIMRFGGTILQGLLIEGGGLSFVNSQSSIMTKAARILQAAPGGLFSEQSLRRSFGFEASLAGALACYKAGFNTTSNVMGDYLFGIPSSGTMAHAFVMFFDEEMDAFLRYAETFPDDALFLVDTYNTKNGIKTAIIAAKKLQEKGRKLVGIRLDSGDLAYLSKLARQMLDEAGLQYVKIFASNSLDEDSISSLMAQGVPIAAWGVGEQIGGCKLLSGVWKVGGIFNSDKTIKRVCKIADVMGKATNPGFLGLRRYYDENGFIADAIYDELKGIDPQQDVEIFNPEGTTASKVIPKDTKFQDILEPISRDGVSVKETPSLDEVRKYVGEQLAGLSPETKDPKNGYPYPVGAVADVHGLKLAKMHRAKGTKPLDLTKYFAEADG